MILGNCFDINQNIIKVYNNKKIMIIYYNFFDITLKVYKNVQKPSRYKVVLRIALLY